MSLWILHEGEVELDAYRQAWNALADEMVAYVEARRAIERAWFRSLIEEPIRAWVREFGQEFARRWLRTLQRQADRKAFKRKRAARARCGRRR